MDRFVKRIKTQPSSSSQVTGTAEAASSSTTYWPTSSPKTSHTDPSSKPESPQKLDNIEKEKINEAMALEEDDSDLEDNPEPKHMPPGKNPKFKTQPRKRKFNKSWLEDPNFKDWISKSEDPKTGKDRAYCKVCAALIIPHKTDLTRHMKSSKHLTYLKTISNTKPVDKMIQNPDSLNVKRAELKLAGLIAAKNLPISLMDTLSPLMANIFPDSKIAKQIAVKRTKTTDLLNNNLGKEFGEKLYNKLATPGCFFSLIMDETTDKATIKQCAFTVIFFNHEKSSVSCRFFDMSEISSGTAEELVKCLKQTFQKNGVPLDNLVGFSSDTTNVMFGDNLSVVALLKKEFPHVVFVKCSCHLIHLVASKACLMLPRSVKDLLRNIGSHFSRSYHRQSSFKEFQEFFQVDILKILSPSNTRWLSLEACVNRILGQFPALKAYFREVAYSDHSKTSEELLQTMENPFTKTYLEFMSYTLGIFNDFNKLFQSEHPLLHKLQSEVSSLIKVLCSNYMKMDAIRGKDPFMINHKESSLFANEKDLYLGRSATESLQEVKKDPNVKQQYLDLFLKTCQNFYIEAVTQIKNRFVFKDPIFKIINVVDPSEAQTFNTKTLVPIVQQFPMLKNFIDANSLDQEWRNHALLEHEKLGLFSNLYPEDYWGKVSKLKNAAGNPLFQNLTKVMELLMILPFSNASVERIFSDLNNTKTFHRNKLKNQTLVSLMLSREGIEEEGGSLTFEPTKKMMFPCKKTT